MDTVWIQKIEPNATGWTVFVEVGEMKTKVLEYIVAVDREYYAEIAPKRTVEELVRGTFRFLLARETKEEILKKFNLRIIKEYFPEFEDAIKNELSL